MKKFLSLLTLFTFFIIGFLHNSMMAFAMQNNMHEQMMEKMGMDEMDCMGEEKDNSDNSCCISVGDNL
ncbi:MAG: hypothetical protein Q9M94_01985, partial [Candidatus Gracilibacteria bacterium]|nr:hypothetical protein [Candidatus Gracilibacteria bacterium]